MAMALTCIAGPINSAAAQAAEPVRIERDGLKLELASMDRDQVRAFFLARGFPPKDAEHVAQTACLYRSAIGSAFTLPQAPSVSVALSDWQVTPAGGKPQATKVREHWEGAWKEREVPQDAATAFYWSLFPTEQTFAPTDYNWGFLTFGLASGTLFDLAIFWRTDGTEHTAKIEGLQCAQ